MKKISDKIFGTIEIDPVTDEYKLTIPEFELISAVIVALET